MRSIKDFISGALLVCVLAVSLFSGASKAWAATTADWVGAGVGTVLGIADQAAKQEKAKEEQKANQKKLDDEKREQVRDYIFNKIIGMKKLLQANKEKQMWEGLAKQMQDSYRAFPKTQETTTSTIMSVKGREGGVEKTETIVYDKAQNTITVTVEHNPGFKEEMSDKAK